MEDRSNWIEYRGMKFLHIIGKHQRMELRKGNKVYIYCGSLEFKPLVLCDLLIDKYANELEMV